MTIPSALLASSGSEQIDSIAIGVIGALCLQFPERISGCYFEGSSADQASTPLSDIDLTVVFKQRLSPDEQQRSASLAQACKRMSQRNLDLNFTDEQTLLHADTLQFQPDWGPVLRAITLKCASVPIYGHDLRSTMPYVPHGVYRRTMMHFPYLVLAGPRQHPQRLPLPLPFLDPDDEFYGYTGRFLRAPDGSLRPSTKRLTHASGFIATALVALGTEEYVADKRTALVVYRQHINDAWAEHLEDVHRYCRLEWEYAVPTGAADRARLRQLCERELAFENHFLAIYKAYLQAELQAEDPAARAFARERMQRLL